MKSLRPRCPPSRPADHLCDAGGDRGGDKPPHAEADRLPEVDDYRGVCVSVPDRPAKNELGFTCREREQREKDGADGLSGAVNGDVCSSARRSALRSGRIRIWLFCKRRRQNAVKGDPHGCIRVDGTRGEGCVMRIKHRRASQCSRRLTFVREHGVGRMCGLGVRSWVRLAFNTMLIGFLFQ
jgi:hypothetical protein